MRVLAVDPGDKRIGLALSDATGTIATPLQVLAHKSRAADAARIAALAAEHGAERIVVGQAYGEDGQPNLSGRKAARLAGALRAATSLPVDLWEESDSTQIALAARRAVGASTQNIDAHAAAVILQDYLENKTSPQRHEE
jgi:putative Holliday junction resolvase